MRVIDFIPEFLDALTKQLESDELRWGDTWLHRTRVGQEGRVDQDITNYFDQYYGAGIPVPWLKIVGNAMIAWIREQHPEIWKE